MSEPCEMRAWTVGRVEPVGLRQIEKLRRLPGVRRVVVMPDVQAGESSVNGCVVATSGLVYPRAVGQDIGCGMSAVALDGETGELARTAADILDGLIRAVPILKHARLESAGAGVSADELSCDTLRKMALREGLLQLGTLGRGNHFIEVQVDEAARAWLLVHSGSRAMGPAILEHHLRGRERISSLEVESSAGRGYLADAGWAVRYAAQSRRLMCEAAARVLSARVGLQACWPTFVDSPHNFVRAETHGGEALIVHRKSVASARAGEPGVIAGSAGSFSVHVEGRGCGDSLESSSHGAGRVMSRSEARARLSQRDLRRQMNGVHFDQRRAGTLVDEAPAAYRDLRVVLAAQRDLVRVTRRLRPVISMKGG